MAAKGSWIKQKTLSSASNLANLLPTGTVLAFEALMPSFPTMVAAKLPTSTSQQSLFHYVRAITCFLLSFTDSFTSPTDGKLRHGIASFQHFYIIDDDNLDEEDRKKLNEIYQVTFTDFIHAFLSVFVFLVFALSNSDVQSCFFPKAGDNQKALITNMPLGAGVLAGFLFSIFPTNRRGIGFADKAPDQQARPSSISSAANKDTLAQDPKV